MPALAPTEFKGRVTWLGRVQTEGDLKSASVTSVGIGFDGVAGEVHSGRTRASCSRVTSQHPKGTEIANVRQMSILSVEELARIAALMEVGDINPCHLGASIVIEGIPDFTHVPPSSRLQGPSGVTLVVDMENQPCVLPGREIEAAAPGHGAAFKRSAQGLRGVTAWVERPGALALGDVFTLHVPAQRGWTAGK